MENVLEFYYEKLKKEGKPGNIIYLFYGRLFSIEVNKGHLIMFNRLIRIFGRFIVFFAVLDLAGMSKVDHKNSIYPLMFTICKGRFEKAHPSSLTPHTTKLKTSILNRELEKAEKRNISIPDSSELD